MAFDFLQEIKSEYDLCINKSREYQQKVDYSFPFLIGILKKMRFYYHILSYNERD